jgi:cytochrome d ubiquinol oxidase subunit II
MSGEGFVWLVMGVGLVVWVLTGGADFGGGLWSLVATGPRRREQRDAVFHAIAPIWEANHVWLIFLIVLLFTVFPRAFAAVSVALHVPLLLALVGIVLRGAAFAFHSYGLPAAGSPRVRWGRVFSWASLVTPVLLGMSLAALSTGAIRVVDGRVTTGFFAGWTTPFAVLVGLFALALFGLLAAIYLTVETEGELRADFRRRALLMEVVAGALAALTFWRAADDAPLLYAELARSGWTWPVQGATAAAALGVLGALWRHRLRLARVLVGAQVSLVVIGWGLAMDRHLVLPDLPITAAGAEPAILRALGPALAAGTLLLAPSLWYLYRVFKGRRG